MGTETSRLTAAWHRAPQPAAKFFQPSQLRRLRGTEQVAAVCYRVNGRGIEFLLVQTRGQRWTFPKGSVEAGLTHAQAAALEAFEEAGVHGRMEEAAFTRYVRRRRGDRRHSDEGSSEKEIAVHAHLCEVLRLGPPQESKRNPTWFSAGKAKRCLREDRTPDSGAEIAGVVDRAVTRIQRLLNQDTAADVLEKQLTKDGLQKVRFEAAGFQGRVEVSRASFVRYIRRQRGEMGHTAAIELAGNAYPGRVLRFGPAQVAGGPELPAQRLLSGTTTGADALQRVTRIDKARGTTGKSKASRLNRKNRRNASSLD